MLSTKNNNNNSSLSANTITCDTITINNDIINTNLNNSINTISGTVNNLSSQITVTTNGVNCNGLGFYFNSRKVLNQSTATSNTINTSLFIDQLN